MKTNFFSSGKKLGILGAGQLGKMLLPATQVWDIYVRMLDPDPEAPCSSLCHEFVCGSLMDYDTVYQFGKQCDLLTIEIEHVNTDALEQLEKEGLTIHPKPSSLRLIQDKGLQKEFYQKHQFPTAEFELFPNKESVLDAMKMGRWKIPFVQKSRKDGYDGKGVLVVKSEEQINQLFDSPCLLEKAIDIQTEIAVIASRNSSGETLAFDATMMDFHEGANMLDTLLYPAPIQPEILLKAKEMACRLIEKLDICGVLAVEYLLDQGNNLLVNEVAPRPHNSGHQTIEASITSQYQQHIRGILNLPLGSTECLRPAVMVNIVGEDQVTGPVYYEGIEEALREEGVYVHLYGKKITKPYRKMGHITVLQPTLEQAKEKALWVKQKIKATSLK